MDLIDAARGGVDASGNDGIRLSSVSLDAFGCFVGPSRLERDNTTWMLALFLSQELTKCGEIEVKPGE